jgi:DNA replication protein DnaD
MPKFLVEIKTKTWIQKPMTVCYKEVEASEEYYARHIAFRDFENELRYMPSVRKLLEDNGLKVSDVAASDAVEL